MTDLVRSKALARAVDIIDSYVLRGKDKHGFSSGRDVEVVAETLIDRLGPMFVAEWKHENESLQRKIDLLYEERDGLKDILDGFLAVLETGLEGVSDQFWTDNFEPLFEKILAMYGEP